MFRACASGKSSLHGTRSSRFLAMAMDLVGGSSTCAQSPWKEMRMNEEGEEEEEEGASQ